MKEINGRITFLVNKDYTTIEVEDKDASVTFLRIELTPEQLSSALSRLGYTPCEHAWVSGLERVGKRMEMRKEKVYLPWEWYVDLPIEKKLNLVGNRLEELASEIGWMNYTHLTSQDTFVVDYKEGTWYVNAVFRRWI